VNHDELRGLIPVYALDALDGDEERQVRMHMEGCPDCRTLLESQLQAAAHLGLVADPATPPAALRPRLMAALAGTPQSAPPTPPAELRPRQRESCRRMSALVAVTALLALGAFAYRQTRQLQERDRMLATQGQLLQALASPLATAVPLTGTGAGGHASAELYISGDKHTAGLVASGLSDPGRGIYQLWLIDHNVPAPLQAFRPNASGLALVQIRADLSTMQGMAVTLEDRAGKPKPQGPYVLRG
jgi:anti-sigma-K factor RskA